MKNRQLNNLNKAYNKRFNNLKKLLIKVPQASIILFVEHLKYIRDICIISNLNISENASLAALMIAIDEFEAYQVCEDNKLKEFHWKNFCEFLKLNMEEWLVLNDPI